MEFVIVRFPGTRTVFIDGGPQGDTNLTKRVDAGPHDFDLGSPMNYVPNLVHRNVQGTTIDRPMEVVFELEAVDMAVPAEAPKARKRAPRQRRTTRKPRRKTPKASRPRGRAKPAGAKRRTKRPRHK